MDEVANDLKYSLCKKQESWRYLKVPNNILDEVKRQEVLHSIIQAQFCAKILTVLIHKFEITMKGLLYKGWPVPVENEAQGSGGNETEQV